MNQHGPCKIYIISTRITQSQYWSIRCKYRIYLNAFGHTSDGIVHAGQFGPCRVNRAIVISSSHKVCAREIEQCAHHTRTRTPHAPSPHRQLNAYRTQLGAYIAVLVVVHANGQCVGQCQHASQTHALRSTRRCIALFRQRRNRK